MPRALPQAWYIAIPLPNHNLGVRLTSKQGFEVIKQLLEKSEPYNFILGARDIERTQAAFDEVKFDASKHTISLVPLDLTDLRSVQLFAQNALTKLGPNKLDLLFLCAGMVASAEGPGPHGSQWCTSYVVNHLCRLTQRIKSAREVCLT